MSKQEFLAQLRKALSGLPQDDIEERLMFYSEIIDDQLEEGLSEKEAVSAVGSVNEIIEQTIADIPFAKVVKERIRPKRQLKAWKIVLLALGSPIWFSLGIVTLAVIFSLYVSLWAVIASLWATFAALAACAIVSVPRCIVLVAEDNGTSGVAILSAGIICIGLSIMTFYGCREVTKGILILTKKFAVFIKNCFIKKGELQ